MAEHIEYGFRADGGPIVSHIFGTPIESEKQARKAGEKSYTDTLEIFKRAPGGGWVPVEED